jgi:Domain of unknown function (DUF5069)
MLAGCIWLARLTDKIRLHHAGILPDGYVPFLGHPRGVDGHFLRHFGLSQNATFHALAEAADDSSVERWFLNDHDAIHSKITSWNMLAPNLGRTGFPAVAELQFLIKRILEPEARVPGIATIFEAIELDDKIVFQKHSKI